MSQEYDLDCYSILEVASDSKEQEIKKAYHRLQKLYHIDYGEQSLNNFKQKSKRARGENKAIYEARIVKEYGFFLTDLNDAYKILMTKRDAYDEYVAKGGPEANKKYYSNGSYYVGESFKGKAGNDIPHGTGQYYNEDGNLVYDGNWKKGNFHGSGKALYPDGIYDGEFVNGKRHGNGKYTYDNSPMFGNGSVFVGRFKKNEIGHGTMHYANGDRYEGGWDNYKPHGYGKKTFKNGIEQSGKWNNGDFKKASVAYTLKSVFLDTFDTPAKKLAIGTFGIAAWLTGTVAVGALLHNINKKNINWNDVSTYETLTPIETVQWMSNLFNKTLKVEYHTPQEPLYVGDAVLYSGYSIDGRPHRSGQIIFSDLSTYRGGFKDGKQHGKGQMLYADGGFYQGEWYNGLRQGKGEMVCSDGSIYKGLWNRGVPRGEGSMLYLDGSTYIGGWVLGKKHGYGIFKKYNGETFEGEWDNDIWPKKGIKTPAGSEMELFSVGRFDGNIDPCTGTIIYNSGTKFFGECLHVTNGFRALKGRMVSSSGTTSYTGRFKSGVHYDGLGSYLKDSSQNKYMYFGDFYHGNEAGFGQLHKMFSWYRGPWNNGEHNTLSNKTLGLNKTHRGDLYFGEWKDDSKHGFGIMLYHKKVSPSTSEVYKAYLRKSVRKSFNVSLSLYSDAWKHKNNGTEYIPDPTRKSNSFSNSELFKLWHPKHLNGMERYEGAWANNMRSGPGKIVYSDGSTYEGGWANDKRHGEGTHISAKGTVYSGGWKDGGKHGSGSEVFKNGDSYAASWSNGLKNGKGTYITAAGVMHSQSWNKGRQISGEILVSPDLDHIEYDDAHYVGETRNGVRNGAGTYTWNNGNIYYGLWVDGSRDGYGTLVYASGGIYEGEWKDSNKDGYGTLVYADGGIYEGEWKEGNYHGQGKVTYGAGAGYNGQWKDSQRNGYGKIIYSDGSFYEGQWKGDLRNGWGQYKDKDGESYIGQWKNNKRDGYGRGITNKQVRTVGSWKIGRPYGQFSKISSKGHITKAFKSEVLYRIPARMNSLVQGLTDAQIKISDSDIYYGQLNDKQQPHGRGIIVRDSGAIYEGAWAYGIPNGKGIKFFIDGDIYTGDWKKNKPNGKGMGIIGKSTYGESWFDPFWKNGCYKSSRDGSAAIHSSLKACGFN